jgi:hypothetical protein
MKALRLLLPVATIAVVLASGTSQATADSCPTSNPANTLKLVSGSSQTAKVGRAFSGNLQVALANTNGCAVTGTLAGINVDFYAPGGGASGTFATTASGVAVVGTDSNGTATAPQFTANDVAGSYAVRAESDYGSVTFFLTNTSAGVAATIAATGGSGQSTTVNSPYAAPLQARVLDAAGHAVQGVGVTFVLAASPYGAAAAFLGGGAQATVDTDASGLATSPTIVANGSAGSITATATTSGVSAVATFELANHAATTTIAAVAPAAQRATVGGRYGKPLQVTVSGAGGRPIEGVAVTFALPASASGAGASFAGGGSQATAATDAAGRATSPPVVASSTAGSFTATASIAGGVDPVSFALRNVAGVPHAVSAGAASSASAPPRTRFPVRLAVTVTDEHGNAVAGAAVTFVAPARGASGGFGARRARRVHVTTDADGVAVAPVFTANATAGGYVVRATVRGTARSAAFALVNGS